MTETAGNSNLNSARWNPQDEYYTQWVDIQSEMNAYREYDPDVFRDKVVLLPCDDPEWSNFTKFFALHFMDFGLKKLISTSFAPDSNPLRVNYQPTLFESESPEFDATKTHTHGKKYTLEVKDMNEDGIINIDDLQWEYLEGDGDFRSQEITALRDDADIIMTNPPFSLFREFVLWGLSAKKKLSVIGPDNAVTSREVFPLVRDDVLWKGATANNTDMVFGVPKGTEIKEADRQKAERMGYPPDEDFDYTRLGNSCWWTNIEHGRRHEPLQSLSMDDNIKHSRHKEVKGVGYRKFDNFDAIAVRFVDSIPSDYDDLMGVPISFLSRYNPEQFEIVGMSAYGQVPDEHKVPYKEGHHRPYVADTAVFQRLFIRRKVVS
ncbi:MAG: adenine-specific methyltransferase EcoRI family protein [Actinomycetota bacterium]